TDDRQRLKQFLLGCGQPVNTGRKNRLDRGGNPHILKWLYQFNRAISNECAFIQQGLIDFLHEKRIALGALNYETLERCELCSTAEQRIEHLLGAIAPKGSSRS